jgi:hypothetical protein
MVADSPCQILASEIFIANGSSKGRLIRRGLSVSLFSPLALNSRAAADPLH